MKNNPSIPTTMTDSRSSVEFLTVFGISLLFTFAGLHYMKMLPSQRECVKTDINYALADELPAHPELRTISLRALEKLLP